MLLHLTIKSSMLLTSTGWCSCTQFLFGQHLRKLCYPIVYHISVLFMVRCSHSCQPHVSTVHTTAVTSRSKERSIVANKWRQFCINQSLVMSERFFLISRTVYMWPLALLHFWRRLCHRFLSSLKSIDLCCDPWVHQEHVTTKPPTQTRGGKMFSKLKINESYCTVSNMSCGVASGTRTCFHNSNLACLIHHLVILFYVLYVHWTI
jgi:hypothetical protein